MSPTFDLTAAARAPNCVNWEAGPAKSVWLFMSHVALAQPVFPGEKKNLSCIHPFTMAREKGREEECLHAYFYGNPCREGGMGEARLRRHGSLWWLKRRCWEVQFRFGEALARSLICHICLVFANPGPHLATSVVEQPLNESIYVRVSISCRHPIKPPNRLNHQKCTLATASPGD